MARLNKRYVRPIPLPREQPAPVDHNEPGAPVIPSRLDVYSDVRQGPWTYLASMIALAAACYVVAVSFGTFLFRESAAGRPLLTDESFWANLAMVTMVLLPTVPAVAVYTGLACLVAMPSYSVLARVLGFRWGWELHGAVVGGIVALIGFLPLHFLLKMPDAQPRDMATWLLLGPLLATTFLQCGGAYAGYLNWRFCPPLHGDAEDDPRPWSFSLRQLLLLTLVISVVLGGLSATGLLTVPLVALVESWLVWQTVSLPVALWFARWRRRVQVTRFRGRLNAIRRRQ